MRAFSETMRVLSSGNPSFLDAAISTVISKSNTLGGGKVLDDLLVQPVDVAAVAFRVEADRAEEAGVPGGRGSGGGRS